MKFILVIRGWFNIWESINKEQIIVIHHINRLKKKKKPYGHVKRSRKRSMWQNSTLFIINILNKPAVKTTSSIWKVIYEKPAANIVMVKD